MEGGRKRVLRSYAYYADACKEKGIPLTYERSSKNHDRGQVKTKEALRRCLYQKEREGAKVVVKVVKMAANPLYSPSVKENPLFSNRSSSALSSLGSVKSGKSDKSKKKVHDNLAFEMMQGNPMFEKKGKSKSK
jgi:hypothetical protein